MSLATSCMAGHNFQVQGREIGKCVKFIDRVTEAMFPGHIVEKLLSIERPAKKQREVPVGRSNNEGQLVHCFSAIKAVPIFQGIFVTY